MRRTVRFPSAVLAGVTLACALTACTLTVGGQAAARAEPVDVSAFVPSERNPDPSLRIDGVQAKQYAGAQHVKADQRVAYTFSPPMGGNHDQAWAACNGVVYPDPVRSENLVHSLEHGAVWIAYDPGRVDGDGVAALAARVEGQPYMVMSPYPGMSQPISLQSWGHQLALADAADPRIDQFVAALRQNANTFPEPGASCAEVGPPFFSQAAPPPFAPAPQASEADGTAIVQE
jgi:hypothetical protein